MEQNKDLKEDSPNYVWRYIDFEKFVKLINEEKIYFPTPSQFSDPNEIIYELIDGQKVAQKEKSSILGVSCWHKNLHENILMWKTYVSNNYGVAIKIRNEALLSAIKVTEPNSKFIISSGDVTYLEHVDYDKILSQSLRVSENEVPSYKKFFFAKTIEYKGENEFRILIVNPEYLLAKEQDNKVCMKKIQASGEGFLVPFKIDKIEEIVMHPQFPEYMKSILKDLCEKKEFNCKISNSIVKERIKL